MNGITQATQGQLKQINRLIADAIEKVVTNIDLDKDGAQRVIEHGNELTAPIGEKVVALLKDLSVSDKYKNEEVPSSCGYFSGYKKPKAITEQVHILQQLFPGIGNACEKLALGEVSKGNGEGWFAIPKWQSFAPTYGEAVEIVLSKLLQAYNGRFQNCRQGELGSDHLRQSVKTSTIFQKITEEQNSYDILLIPAQFGFYHRGRSVRRVCEIMPKSEFGLGVFEVGIMLLTHSDRLLHSSDLHIDCAGDEFVLFLNDKFSGVPMFFFSGDKLMFSATYVLRAYKNHGSASGFIPQV